MSISELYQSIEDEHREELDREKQKNKRKWSKNIVKLHRTLLKLKKEKQIIKTEIKNCLDLNTYEAEQLLHILIPSIENQCKPRKDDIKPRHMLLITIKYLSAKDSVDAIANTYHIDVDAVKSIIQDTCIAVYWCLRYYFKLPKNDEECKAIAEQFERQRKFPNCVGAVILKHIAITAPKECPEDNLNKNDYYSQIIYALVNANHEIFHMENDFEGSLDGDSVFWNADFSAHLCFNGTMTLPSQTSIRGISLPYVFIADNSFTLRQEVIVPFLDEELTTNERKLFNDRWAYAKRFADDAMELMQSKFKILKTTIDLDVENVKDVINACVALHNYMIRNISSYKVVEIETKSVNVPRDEALLSTENDFYIEDSVYRNSFAKYFSLDTNGTKTECMEMCEARKETNVTECDTNVKKIECLETSEAKTECFESNETKNDCLETKTEAMGTNVTVSECLESNETKNECLETI